MFRYGLYRMALFFFNRYSAELCYYLAERVSDLQYYVSWKDRNAVKNNLRKILPPGADIAFYAREVFRNFGRYLVDFFRMDIFLDKSYIRSHIDMAGLEKIDAVLAKGKGCILVTAHLGNWELGAAILGVLGYSPYVVALTHKEKRVNDLFVSQRAKKNVRVIPVDQAVRQCLGLLRKNNIVAIVADRDFYLRGERMAFLGAEAIIPRGAASFSRKTGAAIVPAFLTREKNGRWRFTIEDPIWPDNFSDQKDERQNILKMVRAYLKMIEKKIRQYPAQWLIFREFWV